MPLHGYGLLLLGGFSSLVTQVFADDCIVASPPKWCVIADSTVVKNPFFSAQVGDFCWGLDILFQSANFMQGEGKCRVANLPFPDVTMPELCSAPCQMLYRIQMSNVLAERTGRFIVCDLEEFRRQKVIGHIGRQGAIAGTALKLHLPTDSWQIFDDIDVFVVKRVAKFGLVLI